MDIDKLQSSFYGGLSGLQLQIPKYQYPPPYQDASRLTYYSTFFNSIEINSSFYKLPMPVTVGKWAASVHEDFRFTFKLWKQITHCKGLYFEKSDVDQFVKAISNAGNRKGCLLIQFPPSIGIEYQPQLEKLLSCIKEYPTEATGEIAIEFRHKSWYQDHIYEMIDTYHATIVIQDIPKSATPMLDLNADFVYVRFHGPTGNYRGSYSEDVLAEYAEYISDWVDEGKRVYVYFNNTMGDAFKNLQELNQLVFD